MLRGWSSWTTWVIVLPAPQGTRESELSSINAYQLLFKGVTQYHSRAPLKIFCRRVSGHHSILIFLYLIFKPCGHPVGNFLKKFIKKILIIIILASESHCRGLGWLLIKYQWTVGLISIVI